VIDPEQSTLTALRLEGRFIMAARPSRKRTIAAETHVPVDADVWGTADSPRYNPNPQAKIEAMAPAAAPYRILALDGGPAALLVILMLTQLEKRVPGLLKKVDLIAGTSAGAISGLMLATKDDPAPMLPVAANFWLNGQLYYKNSIFGLLKALVGLGSINDSKYVQQFLEQQGVLGGKLLGELAKKVVITSFDLNPAKKASNMPGQINWKPKVFNNFGHDEDTRQLAVDVALSSSASPIVTPIHQGKVDGGLIANNPAMVALSQAFKETYHPHEPTENHPRDRDGILMLSLGSGRSRELLNVWNNSWGYTPWLLNLFNPLLLVNAFLSGSMEVVSFEAREMMEEVRFFRLDPFYTDPGVLPFIQADPKKQQATAQSPETQALIDDAVTWIHKSGWMNDPVPAEAVAGEK
jgi:patatin-like phospholipase/acyl hydrolase